MYNSDAAQASTKLPVYCHAGGNGANDQACTQVGDASVAL